MKNFFVSNSGDDRNDGLSEQTAWQTIWRVNQHVLNPGDTVFFCCGDRFEGELVLKQSGTSERPIEIKSCGDGIPPVFSGAMKIKNWKHTGKDRYVCDVEHEVSGFFVDNERYSLARFPSNGFYFIERGDKSSLTDGHNLQLNYDIAGATARIRAVNWQYETVQVKAHQGGTIFFTENMMYQCNPRYGYFLDNKEEFLTCPKQWFHNWQTKQLQIIIPEKTDLNRCTAEASIYKNGIVFGEGVQYVNISNIHFDKYENAAILGLSESANISIQNCQITFANVYGISLEINTHHYQISNNQISDIRGRGISTLESSYNEITHNEVKRCGLDPGYGFDGVNNGIGIAILKTEVTYKISEVTFNKILASDIPPEIAELVKPLVNLPYPDEKFVVEVLELAFGLGKSGHLVSVDNHAVQINSDNAKDYLNRIMQWVIVEVNAQKLESTNNRVAYNYVEQTGYAGIRMDGKQSIAEYNMIKNTLLHMNDGGALYCWAQNEDYTHHNIFRSNMIINALGNCEATANDLAYAYGIYTDNKCHHIIIENNIVVGTVGGILINDEAHHQVIRGNTLYDNQYGLVFSEYFMPGSLTGCETIRNIIFAKRRNQRALFVESRIRENFRPGLFDKNLYANPYYPFPILELTYKDDVRTYKEYTLQSWQKHYGNDTHSETIATSNHDAGGSISHIIINETNTYKEFQLPNDLKYRSLNGDSLPVSVGLSPFSSIIIIQQ